VFFGSFWLSFSRTAHQNHLISSIDYYWKEYYISRNRQLHIWAWFWSAPSNNYWCLFGPLFNKSATVSFAACGCTILRAINTEGLDCSDWEARVSQHTAGCCRVGLSEVPYNCYVIFYCRWIIQKANEIATLHKLDTTAKFAL